MRPRGLKLKGITGVAQVSGVAAHAAAWIETAGGGLGKVTPDVAAHAAAWIETFTRLNLFRAYHVAAHAAAWIETG